jgi:hypothetical protein
LGFDRTGLGKIGGKCGLTPRSSGAPTAWHTGHQALGLRPILRLLSSVPRHYCPLSSNVRPHSPAVALCPQDSGSNMISRTSCAHRQLSAIRAAQANASSWVGTSMIEKPPTTAFVSGTEPREAVPSVATIVACCRSTPPPKIQTPAALAARTTAWEASPTAGQSASGMWFIEPSSNEIRYRGITSTPCLWAATTGRSASIVLQLALFWNRLASRPKKAPPTSVHHRCGLTPRSSRPATAGSVSLVCGAFGTFAHQAYAARLRSRLTSNVRQHRTIVPCPRAKHRSPCAS